MTDAPKVAVGVAGGLFLFAGLVVAGSVLIVVLSCGGCLLFNSFVTHGEKTLIEQQEELKKSGVEISLRQIMDKPQKPYEDFPLFPHATKRWAKKIRGQLHYFGSWAAGWEAALREYERVREYLYTGRQRPIPTDGVTVADVCSAFMQSRTKRVEAGEISQRTVDTYDDTCSRIVAVLGANTIAQTIGPPDFELLRAKICETCGLTKRTNEITYTRMVFNHAFKNKLIDRPVRFWDRI